jgi:hypothetical protein
MVNPTVQHVGRLVHFGRFLRQTSPFLDRLVQVLSFPIIKKNYWLNRDVLIVTK